MSENFIWPLIGVFIGVTFTVWIAACLTVLRLSRIENETLSPVLFPQQKSEVHGAGSGAGSSNTGTVFNTSSSIHRDHPTIG